MFDTVQIGLVIPRKTVASVQRYPHPDRLPIVFSLNLPRSIAMKIAHKIATALFTVSLLATAGCASTATHEGTGEYVDDSVITTKVKASIFNEPTLKSTEINVETYKGTVQLSGFVSQPEDIAKAAEVARGVKGVAAVKNDIRVK
jgi:osmotically-inducible protein OsmY